MMAWTCCTVLMGFSKSVSRVPGAAPRTSTPATAPLRKRIAVQPVGRRLSVKCPTSMPGMLVRLPADSVFAALAGSAAARAKDFANTRRFTRLVLIEDGADGEGCGAHDRQRHRI